MASITQRFLVPVSTVSTRNLAQWPALNGPKIPGGGVLPAKLGGVCSKLPKTLTLFQTKICDFSCPIADLIKNLIPYFRPEALYPGARPERRTSCYGTYTVVGVNIKREIVLSPNDEEVANSSKNIPSSRLEGTNHTLFQTKMVEIDPLFQTKTAFCPAHTYTAYIRGSPPPPRGEKRVADYESRCLRKRD